MSRGDHKPRPTLYNKRTKATDGRVDRHRNKGDDCPRHARTTKDLNDEEKEHQEGSNDVPAQVDKHLEVLDFSSSGDLVVASSSLTTRYRTGQLWYYSRAGHGDNGETATDPMACLTGMEPETGVVGGHFLNPTQIRVGLDSSARALVNTARTSRGGETASPTHHRPSHPGC